MEHGKTENVFNTKQIPDRTEQNKKTKKYLVVQTGKFMNTIAFMCRNNF
ncbi:hypothetical protein T4C_14158 [Trichinella pseudospiralis]|uniref:Uncharacterized protein n=1 Tax=Trichinella pseudospiralis TaxID=6337 RepID=A0A0V1GMB9_TRIPS|nr:hypothetical protein T4C_14158 [Trichinella pseudospiralis]